MRAAVVGHVEWVEFVRVEHVPARGEIVFAGETWSEPAGGGAVAAVQLARHAEEATLVTTLGDDDLGRRVRERLAELGVRVQASVEARPTARAVVFVDVGGERTITVLGGKLKPSGRDVRLPWDELARVDAVYFASGDAAALTAARRARVVVATARELATIREAGIPLDVVVGSGEDANERYRPGDLDPPPRLAVTTAGALGGWVQPGGPYRPAAPPGPVIDSYGCGDSFAAGLVYALGRGDADEDAIALAAAWGAEALTRSGAYG